MRKRVLQNKLKFLQLFTKTEIQIQNVIKEKGAKTKIVRPRMQLFRERLSEKAHKCT